MHSQLFNILNYINEGIIIVNKELQIEFLNQKIKEVLKIDRNIEKVPLKDLIPSLNKRYFVDAILQVFEKKHKFFFSSTMHKGLITDELQLNIKLSQFEMEEETYLIIECIDVTSQIMRIGQLKDYANELRKLNKKLVEQEEEIKRLAYHDNLTGLANRTYFYNMSEKLIKQANRRRKMLSIMFIDIDKFKNINDSYGHEVGDIVLKEVAKILNSCTRESDIVARHGGDEFLILLSDCENDDVYKAVASRIGNANKNIKINEELNIEVSLSIGVSIFHKDGEYIDQLISRADKAMYKVKSIGGNKCKRYSEQ